MCVSALCFTMKLHVPLGQFPKLITAQCLLYVKYEFAVVPAAYTLSTSRASSLELVYAKQPIIIGLTNEFCRVRARRRVAFETINYLMPRYYVLYFDINYHPNIA